ncbi:hypothetical protein DFA_09336 [Cavenderia fasciculata]|uniref:Uncharacterized protein n=1 Tax=Cavenderia fasciculata TaxID=261658 RepID=F4Q7C4_CACFS|nr:uncharacterized protein DFA_09336 [Cavenderia fasciculata]EGG16306.1 hypothetical protein DFA_09336 [Cavenderia fasciculata]|eukprot:XP_004354690.1 hypothetical protein DFA_09336 [Cavenderia fasciculata]
MLITPIKEQERRSRVYGMLNDVDDDDGVSQPSKVRPPVDILHIRHDAVIVAKWFG